MKDFVYVVDVRNLILHNSSALKRHVKYSELLELKSNNNLSFGIIRFRLQKSITFGIQDGLQILTFPSNPFRIVISLLLTKANINNQHLSAKVLVAGDPWESSLCAYLLKSTFFTMAKVQVQIHGDIGNKTWIHLTFRNFLRSKLAKLTLQFADQLRTVSKKQTENLISKYRVSDLKCRVIPVPSLFSTTVDIPFEPRSSTRTIGFVGRLQSDRGINNFLDLVEKLQSAELTFSIIVAGDGPERNSFEDNLRKMFRPENVKFLGNLNQTEMESVWSQIGILVSTAPTESFGRAIREAIAWGVPVWATPSSGVSDIQGEISQLYVMDLDIALPAKRQAEIFNQLLATEIPLDVRKRIIGADLRALESLISSWVELCK